MRQAAEQARTAHNMNGIPPEDVRWFLSEGDSETDSQGNWWWMAMARLYAPARFAAPVQASVASKSPQ
jgi:hypothetical protein